MKRIALIFCLALAPWTASRALAQIAPASGCADCHFARPDAPDRGHILGWDRSPHGRNQVGCENCHGGDPKTFEPRTAHASILPLNNPQSPLNRKNIPATCGKCHTGPFVAFQDSRHFALLQTGNNNGPTCITCHGNTDGRVLSPKALASQCASCHGPNEVAPRATRVQSARELYEGVSAVREQMKLAQSLIRRVDNQQRRAALNEAYEQAQVPLTRAVNAGHKFVYDDLKEFLGVAQQRVNTLMSQLANR